MDLSEIRAIDQHAHNVLSRSRARYPFTAPLGEFDVVLRRDTPHTLFFHRSLRDLAELLNCEPREEIIRERRTALGLDGLARICFSAAKLDGLLLDDGFLPDDLLPLDWHEQFVPVKRVLRLETLAQDLMRETDRFENFLEQFRAAIENTPSNVVALKSIAAYRSGLAIQPVFLETARSRYRILRAQTDDKPVRLADKPLIDFVIGQALEIAARGHCLCNCTRDSAIRPRFRQANPLHLRGCSKTAATARRSSCCTPPIRNARLLPRIGLSASSRRFRLAVPFLSGRDAAGLADAVRTRPDECSIPRTRIWSRSAYLAPMGRASWGCPERTRPTDLTSRKRKRLRSRSAKRRRLTRLCAVDSAFRRWGRHSSAHPAGRNSNRLMPPMDLLGPFL